VLIIVPEFIGSIIINNRKKKKKKNNNIQSKDTVLYVVNYSTEISPCVPVPSQKQE